ncbi:MAG TPA: hypothetical protein VFB80_22430 [Pirellulaceae bacterium]|nr:hypothetical protein [Pirellulaceae bacterium]
MSRVLTSLFAILLALAAVSQTVTAQTADDGWRRTANGWERVVLHHDWVFSAAKSAEPAARFDTHPAALALFMVVTIIGAMVAFPQPKVCRLSWLNESWLDVFRRSFRASVFGS